MNWRVERVVRGVIRATASRLLASRLLASRLLASRLLASRLLALLLVVASFLAAPGIGLFDGRTALAKGEPIVPATSIAELQQRLEAIRVETGIPGVSVAIARRDGIEWASGLGLADIAANKPATADTLFRMGSIGKGLVALAVLQLVHEGRLSLEAPVRSLVPAVAFENPWEDTNPVVVADLLEHTTGWEDLSTREFAFNAPGISLADALNFDSQSRVSRWKPGTRTSYSNAGPAVAAHIVEQVTGMAFEEYARTRLFAPLEMPTATFHEPAPLPGATKLYHRDKVTPYAYLNLLYRPSGALNASARDMGAYLRFYLQRGMVGQSQVLPDSLLQRMEHGERSWYSQAGNPTADGLGSGAVVRDGFVYYGHAGAVLGGLALMEYLPEHGLGYFFALNTTDYDAYTRLGDEIRAYLTRGETRPAATLQQAPPPHAEDYAGWYEPAASRWKRTEFLESLLGPRHASWREGTLHWSDLFGHKVSFVPTGGAGLRLVDHEGKEVPIPTSALIPPNEEGRFVYLEGWYRRIPGALVALRVSLTVMSLVLIVAFVCLAPYFWFRRAKHGRDVRATERRLVGWPLFATASLMFVAATGMPLWEDPVQVFGKPTFWSVGLCVTSLGLAAASVASVLVWASHRHQPAGAFVRGLTLAASLSLVIVAGYLGYHGLIGIRSWA